MTKREQLKNYLIDYLFEILETIKVASDETFADIYTETIPCSDCCADKIDCRGARLCDCNTKIIRYLQKHGDEEVEE